MRKERQTARVQNAKGAACCSGPSPTLLEEHPCGWTRGFITHCREVDCWKGLTGLGLVHGDSGEGLRKQSFACCQEAGVIL